MALVFNMVGGSSSVSSVSKKDVNFYDYDGTLVAGYTIAEAQALSALPDAPDHSSDDTPLTFQEWNYTLAQINAATDQIDVGATYITADGKTHLHITLTTVSGLTETLYLNKSDTSALTVDWGDGNTSASSSSGNINFSHTYSAAGNYVISIWISSGAGYYTFGNGTSTTVCVGGNTEAVRHTLTAAFIGSKVETIGTYAFSACFSLSIISVPDSVLAMGDSTFDGCISLLSAIIPNAVTSVGTSGFANGWSLICISLPRGITSIGYQAIYGCYSLTSVVIPSNVTAIAIEAFENCYSLKSAVIPSSVTTIGNYAFNGCYALNNYKVERATPPTLGTNVFSGILSICKIKVPSASLATYKTATNWSTYANYMEGY